MGYSTYYTCVATHSELHEEILKWANENRPELCFAIDAFDGSCYEDCKWYGHDADMEAVSAEFPDVTFNLHGEGERSLDIWDKCYKAGRIVKESCVESDLKRFNQLLTLTKELIISVNNGQNYGKHITALEVKLHDWKEL